MRLPALFVFIIALTFYGCSSKGDSPPMTTSTTTPPPSPPIDPNMTVPVKTAFANIVQHGFNQSFTISGSVDNSTPSNPGPPTPVTGSGRFVLGSAIQDTLCTFQVFAAPQTITGTTIANGASTPFSTTGTVYYRADNTIVATSSAGELFLFTPQALPATVKAGDTGPTGTGTQFESNCTQSSFGDTITGSYLVASDSANSLLVTFVSVRNTVATGTEQTSTMYRITTAGDVTLVSITDVKTFLGTALQTFVFTF